MAFAVHGDHYALAARCRAQRPHADRCARILDRSTEFNGGPLSPSSPACSRAIDDAFLDYPFDEAIQRFWDLVAEFGEENCKRHVRCVDLTGATWLHHALELGLPSKSKDVDWQNDPCRAKLEKVIRKIVSWKPDLEAHDRSRHGKVISVALETREKTMQRLWSSCFVRRQPGMGQCWGLRLANSPMSL